ncbi:MAG: phosphoribosyltransferase [Gammaproteobacteria bacterium]|nr:hypothetical protein [Pseudomonadales bacterium]
MTSGTPFPSNLTEIDQLTRSDHSYLNEEDQCYFLGEYTARQSYSYSDTNSLIMNLKKKMDRRNEYEWRYKTRDITRAGTALGNALHPEWLNTAAFVPIPPSKAKHDPMYDDRMSQVIAAMRPQNPVDCRELIIQTTSTDAAHESDNRPSPRDILRLYELDHSLIEPRPLKIVICDDVLTTGAHFKAAKTILTQEFPDAVIIGCFIARRVPEAVDVENFIEDWDD